MSAAVEPASAAATTAATDPGATTAAAAAAPAPSPRPSTAPMSTKKRVDALYNVMGAIENKLGGGEGVEGIYGSITATGMQRILDCLAHSCGLGPGSAVLDVGAGLGRPLLHAAVAHGVRRLYGVEIDRVKVAKAEAFLRQSVAALAARGVPYVQEEGQEEQRQEPEEAAAASGAAAAAATTAAAASSQEATDTRADDGEASLNVVTAAAAASARPQGTAATEAGTTMTTTTARPSATTATPTTQQQLPLITCCPVERLAPDALAHVTHAYSFWEGVPRHARLAFGRLFAASPRARGVAVVQRAMRGGGGGGKSGAKGADPSAEMAALGFGSLALVRAFPVSMSGSGRSFTAYVFMRVRPLAPLLAAPALLPANAAADEDEDEEAATTTVALANCVYLRTSTSDPVGGRRAGGRSGSDTAAIAAPDAGSPCKRAGSADGASPEKKARGVTPARHMTRSQSAALAAAEAEEEEAGEEVAAPPAVRKALSFGGGGGSGGGGATAAAAAAAAPAPKHPRGGQSRQGTLSFRERKQSSRAPAVIAAATKAPAAASAPEQEAPPPPVAASS